MMILQALIFGQKEKSKYDESYIITAPPKGDVLENGEALCEVTLQLAAKVLTTKRKYMTLIDA